MADLLPCSFSYLDKLSTALDAMKATFLGVDAATQAIYRASVNAIVADGRALIATGAATDPFIGCKARDLGVRADQLSAQIAATGKIAAPPASFSPSEVDSATGESTLDKIGSLVKWGAIGLGAWLLYDTLVKRRS